MVTAKQLTVGVIKVGLLFGVVASGFWVITHRQDVLDWWKLRTYKPTSDIVALADADMLVGYGRDMFYVADPKVEDSQAFNMHCNDVGEQGSVLGCYTPTQRIYIYNVTDSRLPHVKEVTAAHEALHAVYERLDSATKKHINLLVQAEADKLKNDADLQAVIKIYAKSEPGEALNELHSILGTEYANLSPELEAHYKLYFGDRAKVVGYAQQYKAVFKASKDRIAGYDARLGGLKTTIDQDEADLTSRRRELDQESARLNSLRDSDPIAYNQQVPAYNAKAQAFNALAHSYNNLVKEYNALVVTRNQEVGAQNDLYHSLDSKYQAVSTN